jgi:cyclopropane-fatty-acyl-phospholipid synthase
VTIGVATRRTTSAAGDVVRPGGRIRGNGRCPGGGPFVAPDVDPRPVGETVAYLEGGGLEVRDVPAVRERCGHAVPLERAW